MLVCTFALVTEPPRRNAYRSTGQSVGTCYFRASAPSKRATLRCPFGHRIEIALGSERIAAVGAADECAIPRCPKQRKAARAGRARRRHTQEPTRGRLEARCGRRRPQRHARQRATGPAVERHRPQGRLARLHPERPHRHVPDQQRQDRDAGRRPEQQGDRTALAPLAPHHRRPLHRIFPKLGITSRAALRDALATLPPDQDRERRS